MRRPFSVSSVIDLPSFAVSIHFALMTPPLWSCQRRNCGSGFFGAGAGFAAAVGAAFVAGSAVVSGAATAAGGGGIGESFLPNFARLEMTRLQVALMHPCGRYSLAKAIVSASSSASRNTRRTTGAPRRFADLRRLVPDDFLPRRFFASASWRESAASQAPISRAKSSRVMAEDRTTAASWRENLRTREE